LDTPDGVACNNDIKGIAERYLGGEVEEGLLPLQGLLETIKWKLDAKKTETVFRRSSQGLRTP